MNKKKLAFLIGGVCLSFVTLSSQTNVLRNYFSSKSFKSSSKPDVTLVGRVVLGDGICRLGIDIADCLKDFASIGVRAPKKNLLDMNDYQKSIFSRDNKTWGKVVILTDALFYQTNDSDLPKYDKIITGQPKKDEIRYVYSMLESSKIPQIWCEIINSKYDAVIVPDPYLVDVYKKCGVQKPVFMVPFPLLLEKFLDQPVKNKKSKVFTFGCTSSNIKRKNLITLVKAFHKTFGYRDDVCLRINSRYVHADEDREILDYLARSKTSNIHYSKMLLTNDEYLTFMKSFDCFVTLSRGEGFSIQPRQAMALGIPTIVTDNTAQGTVANNKLSYRVPCNILHNAHYFFSKEPIGYDFGCKEEDVCNALYEVYSQYDKYASKSEEYRNWAKKYDISNLKEFYKQLVKPKKVVLGNVDEVKEDCIVTTSQELYKKYKKIGF